ncbi:MAG: aminotransferase class III-fold pyridoxal phosphate-dependent enzyme [Ilumatobacteraceae bacterium]
MYDVFDTGPPAFDDALLADAAQVHFGLAGDLTPLDSERDQNVRIATGDGTFVMKIANGAESPEVLDLQQAALRHLARTAPGLAVPAVLPAIAGEPVVTWHGHLVRCVSHLPGEPLADVERTDALERDLGRTMGALSAGMRGFGHPAAHRADFLWNLDAAQRCTEWLDMIAVVDDRRVVEAAFERHRARVVPVLDDLRGAVVHHDANDRNVLVHDGVISGIIDFGDMVFARQVNELAVTLAYALLDVPDIVATSRRIIGGYTAEMPLEPDELRVLFDLVVARLAMSVAISSHRSREFPDNDYLTVSQAPALALLRRLMAMRPEMLHFVARDAAGLQPVPRHDAIVAFMRSEACRPVSPLPFDLDRAGRLVISLADGAPGMQHASDPVAYWGWLEAEMAAAGAEVAFGRYDEDRNCYGGDQFTTDAPEPRSVHIGIDLFVAADTPVRAMLPGRVVTVVDNDAPFDYGPTVILEHDAGDAGSFWCLYGHLSRRTLSTVAPGDEVAAGQVVGFVGDHTVNGGWAPHVHLQLITDLMADPVDGPNGNFEGAGEPSRMSIWRSIAPDANLLLRLQPETFTPAAEPEALLSRRQDDLLPSLSVSYRRRLHIVRGRGPWLYDHTGRAHLDGVNNVCHVGHAHPHVVDAIARQAAQLNTNTRYLHPLVLEYAERLAATFPGPLSVVCFVNSGSEANELALRMARTVTGRRDVVAVDWGYHGNTNATIEVSAYKFNRRGGAGRPPHVQLAELPDPYRGRVAGYDESAGAAFASSVDDAIARAYEHDDRGPAAFIAESISGCGGQVVFPQGYLRGAYERARAAGALCIADEVQVGFGRVGSAMWAFELQGVVPDIVTLGKPMGNGHPLAAVVTTPEIAAAFANGMEFFATFGGNPVSCAAGMAVLDVIEDEQLVARAADTGAYLIGRLRHLQQQHEAIGDVRGEGLYLGVDLVTDRTTRQPATALAGDVVEAMRAGGVLLSTDGPSDNVVKIKPPIVFTRDHADIVVAELDRALATISHRR